MMKLLNIYSLTQIFLKTIKPILQEFDFLTKKEYFFSLVLNEGIFLLIWF